MFCHCGPVLSYKVKTQHARRLPKKHAAPRLIDRTNGLAAEIRIKSSATLTALIEGTLRFGARIAVWCLIMPHVTAQIAP